jgi:hypothetical protein
LRLRQIKPGNQHQIWFNKTANASAQDEHTLEEPDRVADYETPANNTDNQDSADEKTQDA